MNVLIGFSAPWARASSLLTAAGYSVMERFQWSRGAINPACCVYHYHRACVQFLFLLLRGDTLWILSQPGLLREGGRHSDKCRVKRDSCIYLRNYNSGGLNIRTPNVILQRELSYNYLVISALHCRHRKQKHCFEAALGTRFFRVWQSNLFVCL